MVISIAAFATTEEMKRGLQESFSIREETLNRCYAMENYADLPHAEKNRIYDSVRKEVENSRRKIL